MRHRYLTGTSIVALLGSLSGCTDRPPARTWAFDGNHHVAASSSVSANDEPPDVADVPYPGPAYGTGPAEMPAGVGASVPPERYIVVDQFGYLPTATKVAILADPKVGWNATDAYAPSATLEVRRWSDGKVVASGPVKLWNNGAIDETAGDRGSWFDFSGVREEGTYYVYDPDKNVRSHPFVVAADVYRPVLKAALKMFYFNRANVEKKAPHACYGKLCWSLAADHVGPGQDGDARSVRAQNDPTTTTDLRGGWWDAGDTNKYTTFSNEPVHQLLTAYSERSAVFGDDFGIPESGNGIPDILDEVRVELEWLKRMQPASLRGAARLKAGNIDFVTERPDLNRRPRFYYPEACSSATIVVAGEFAHAALVFRGIPALAQEAQELARRATEAFQAYERLPKRDDCDDGTIRGGDADQSVATQTQIAVVAAVYLFALTYEEKYDEFVRKNYGSTRPFTDNTWAVYQPSQGDALLYYSKLERAHGPTRDAIRNRLLSLARSEDGFRFRPELDLYRAYMRPDAYHWGSNDQRASYGNTNLSLLHYGLVDAAAGATYRERAAGLLHSFHGVNPMQLVYLSNMYPLGAEESVSEIYHEWFRDKDPTFDSARSSILGPAPGYVAGGANAAYCKHQDPKEHACANSPARRQPAEKAYVDGNTGWEPFNPYDKLWEFSEPGIYYQASYVRLVSKF